MVIVFVPYRKAATCKRDVGGRSVKEEESRRVGANDQLFVSRSLAESTRFFRAREGGLARYYCFPMVEERRYGLRLEGSREG